MIAECKSGLLKAALVLPLLFTQVGFAADAPSKEYLNGLVSRWEQAFNKEDGAALANDYAENAVFIGDEPEIFNGRSAIANVWPEHYKRAKNLKIVMTDAKMISADVVQMVGTWSAELKDKPVQFIGKWITLRQKVGNDWPVITHMTNSKVVKTQ